MDSVRFYFSFRSPYSWLAFHRIDRIVDECPVRFEYISLFRPQLDPETISDLRLALIP